LHTKTFVIFAQAMNLMEASDLVTNNEVSENNFTRMGTVFGGLNNGIFK
jgi:hypothetical protein